MSIEVDPRSRVVPISGSLRGHTVAYLVSLFPCWSETFIVREILALRRRGAQVRIYSLKPPNEEYVHEAARMLHKEVIYPPAMWRLALAPCYPANGFLQHPAWSFLQAIRDASDSGLKEIVKAAYTVAVATYFADKVRRLGVAHVHAHWATYPALAARTIRTLVGTPYTVTAHAHDLFLPNPYRRATLASAHTIVTISEYNRRYLGSLGIPLEQVKVVRCGLDLEEFTPLRNGEGVERTPGSIVTVARLHPIKGLSDLISACAILRARGIELDCKVIGDGPLRRRLEQQIRDHGLEDKVQLVGVLNQREIREILSRTQVFVLPCVQTEDGAQDGIPVSLMEAMALRENTERPITVTDGTNRLVGTDTGKIVSGFQEAIDERSSARIPELWDGKTSMRITNVIREFLHV